MTLPRAAAIFVRFGAVLRANGFPVEPEQTTSFLQAVTLLGPRGMADIRRAAHATLAPPAERRAEFDALFDAVFLGRADAGLATGAADDDEMRLRDPASGPPDTFEERGPLPAGQAAATAERLASRRLDPAQEDATLRRFAHAAPSRLPRRRGRRLVAAGRGGTPDLRRSLREAVRTEGDVATLRWRRHKTRPRPILLLIDVSGSMKARTDANLRFAHGLAQAAGRIEVFTLGTRLTRVTRAIRLRRREQALDAVAGTVADWDGGTRIGDALQAFLAVPRFGGYARGAAVMIVSDGLERGDPAALVAAVTLLSRRAWRLSWLSPLAADDRYRPQTQAMAAIAPLLDDLAPAADTAALCAHALALADHRR